MVVLLNQPVVLLLLLLGETATMPISFSSCWSCSLGGIAEHCEEKWGEIVD